MDKTVSNKIYWTTFIANILILLHHANLLNYFPDRVTKISEYVMDMFSKIAIPAMSWFFFISAYLFFRKFNMNKLLDKWKARIRSLLIPFLIWNTLAVILQLAGGHNIFENGLVGFFRYTYLFFNDTGCANGPLWYIFRLLTYIIIAPAIFGMVKNKKIVFTGVICMIIIAYNIIAKTSYFSFFYFLPIYILGAYLGVNCNEKFEKWIKRADKKGKIFGCISVVMLVVGVYMVQNLSFAPLSMLYRYIAIALIVAIIKCVDFSIKASPIVRSGGMFFYCEHDLIYRVVRTIIKRINCDIMLSWSLLVLLSFFIMLLSWWTLKRYAPKLLSVLCGGRS